jgi:hypothetical protein
MCKNVNRNVIVMDSLLIIECVANVGNVTAFLWVYGNRLYDLSEAIDCVNPQPPPVQQAQHALIDNVLHLDIVLTMEPTTASVPFTGCVFVATPETSGRFRCATTFAPDGICHYEFSSRVGYFQNAPQCMTDLSRVMLLDVDNGSAPSPSPVKTILLSVFAVMFLIVLAIVGWWWRYRRSSPHVPPVRKTVNRTNISTSKSSIF